MVCKRPRRRHLLSQRYDLLRQSDSKKDTPANGKNVTASGHVRGGSFRKLYHVPRVGRAYGKDDLSANKVNGS